MPSPAHPTSRLSVRNPALCWRGLNLSETPGWNVFFRQRPSVWSRGRSRSWAPSPEEHGRTCGSSSIATVRLGGTDLRRRFVIEFSHRSGSMNGRRAECGGNALFEEVVYNTFTLTY